MGKLENMYANRMTELREKFSHVNLDTLSPETWNLLDEALARPAIDWMEVSKILS